MRVENAGVRVHCVRPRLQVAVCRASAAYELAARRDGLFADVLRLFGHARLSTASGREMVSYPSTRPLG
jgi:hypothetical protein